EQSLRIAEDLNLTDEVKDGILTHTGEREPASLEGKTVRIVDRVAYINHDIDDAVRFGILQPDDLPQAEVALLGDTGAERIDRPVRARIRRAARLMARIKDASVEEVKDAADIVAVVSARTQLRKAGARYMGRCPFHDERTPSFSVNAADKLYYCFGCGAKGDL